MYDSQGAAAIPETGHPAVDTTEPTAGATMTAVADHPDLAAIDHALIDHTPAVDAAAIGPAPDPPPTAEASTHTAVDDADAPVETPAETPAETAEPTWSESDTVETGIVSPAEPIESEPAAEAVAEPVVEPEAVAEPVVEPETVAEAVNEPEVIAEAVNEPETLAEPEPDAVTETETTTEPETVVVHDDVTAADAVTEQVNGEEQAEAASYVDEPDVTAESEAARSSAADGEAQHDPAESEAARSSAADGEAPHDPAESEAARSSAADGEAQHDPAGPEEAAVPDEVEPAEAVAVPAAALTILPSVNVQQLRARMIAAAEQFESSPTAAVAQAELVVTEAVVALHHALLDGAVNLGAWRRSDATEPAELAEVMRGYREYLDRVLVL